MSAGRVARHEDAIGIAAERSGVAMNPDDRRATLAHELVHVDRGDQRVVDHDDRRARRLERARDEARVGLVEPMPVAAVNEDVYRRGWAPCGEHVEPFAGMRTIREIE